MRLTDEEEGHERMLRTRHLGEVMHKEVLAPKYVRDEVGILIRG